jgi:hypothetical protein
VWVSLGFRLVIAVALLHPTATPVWAWGNKGHRLVARVAEGHLTDKTKQAIADLLEQGETLADASTYPDEHKREIPGSTPWHFVNVPITASEYDAKFCSKRGCVVSKLKQFQGILKDKSRSLEDRRMALRFVVHLVGDLHQPFHVGDNHDQGGNGLQVRFFGSGSNLHKVWDSDLIEKVNHSERQWLDVLQKLDTPESREKYMSGVPEDWATESLLAAKKAYRLPDRDQQIESGESLGAEYLDENIHVVRLRLCQAGLRLAWVLNDALGKSPALSDRVKKLALEPGRKIEAIKVYREETGAGLADAKDAIEAFIASVGR